MTSTINTRQASPLMVILAFATVYIVWGSTYFFIQRAIHGFPPFILGVFRFSVSGIIMLAWSAFTGEKIFNWKQVKPAIVSGLMLLFVGNGAVIWVEQYLPSGLVAIIVSSAPIWFVVLDKPKWRESFSSKSTIMGLLIGFGGVMLLFYPNLVKAFSAGGHTDEIIYMIIITIGTMSWAGGSLYSKYYSSGSSTVNSAWQMLSAAVAFLICSLIKNEPASFQFSKVPASAWWAVIYLIVVGSIVAYSAYVWLLNVRPATQVSTYAYVNPVVAVLLGVVFANETIGLLQIGGLVVILLSVLLINLAKYNKERNAKSVEAQNS